MSNPPGTVASRGVMTAERARGGFAKLLADDRVADSRGLQPARRPPTIPPSAASSEPSRIPIDGPIDAMRESWLGRRIKQARIDKTNLIVFEIDSPGGIEGVGEQRRRDDLEHQGHEDRRLS